VAPTTPLDSVVLDRITYTDPSGALSDITDPSWRTPLEFRPWYTTGLSALTDITIATGITFSGGFRSYGSTTEPSATALYHIAI
jgi:hypothetical protein